MQNSDSTMNQDISCRLCGVRRMRRKFCVNGQDVLTCNACGFWQVRERPTENDVRLLYSAGYFDTVKYDDGAGQEKENDRRMNLLRRFLPPGAKLLDAGCATGDFLAKAAKEFAVWGADISAEAIDRARQRHPELKERLQAAPVEETNFPEEFFDGIVLWDVVEHLWDPVSALKHLHPKLSNGGYLFLSTPDPGAWTSRLLGKYWPFMTPPEHLCFLNAAVMRFLLKEKLAMTMVHRASTGKWVHPGFLLRKVKRIFPALVPQGVIDRLRDPRFKDWLMYVPSKDIQYAVARKGKTHA